MSTPKHQTIAERMLAAFVDAFPSTATTVTEALRHTTGGAMLYSCDVRRQMWQGQDNTNEQS